MGNDAKKSKNPHAPEKPEPIAAQLYRNKRRQLVNSVAAGAGAVIAGKSLPSEWARPVINSVVLPAHAQTSGTIECRVRFREGDGATEKFSGGSYTVDDSQIGDSTQDIRVSAVIPGAGGKVANLNISGTSDGGGGDDSDDVDSGDGHYFVDISGPTDQDQVVSSDGQVSFQQLSANPSEFFDGDDAGNDATLTFTVSCPGFEDCVIDLAANPGSPP